MASKVGKGFSAQLDVGTHSAELLFGESLVYSWPLARGVYDELLNRSDTAGIQWRVDKFVAERIGELFRSLEPEDEG